MNHKHFALPTKPGVPNAFTTKAEVLLNSSTDLAKLLRSIRSVAKTAGPGASFADIKQACVKAGLRSEASKIRAQYETAITPPQSIGPPPSSRELYGRFADGVSITDFGSGNCMKLKPHTGRKIQIKAIDPKLPSDEDLKSVNVIRIRREFVVSDIENALFCVSFNFLCNIPNNDMFSRHDGLHIFPDHKYLLDHGQAVEKGELVEVRAGDRVYTDHRVSMTGIPIREGYTLGVGYSKSSISISLQKDFSSLHRWSVGSYKAKIQATPATEANMNWKDLGYKWDGQPFEVESVGGEIFVTSRTGRYTKNSRPYVGPGFCFQVEYLSEPSALVLLRVVHWNGMIPPHSGDCLRLFAKRKRITIDGLLVFGPPVFDPEKPASIDGTVRKIDGLITRTLEKDYYTKPVWTVDLRPNNVLHLREALEKIGKELLGVDPLPGLNEYSLVPRQGAVELSWVRERNDKDKETPLSTIEYLVSLPTLHELVAMYGHMPELQGMRKLFIDV